jgi:hypothetical protein
VNHRGTELKNKTELRGEHKSEIINEIEKMSATVYSFHWINVSRSKKPKQDVQPTNRVPETPTTHSTETKNTQNSQECSSSESPEK